MLVEFRSTGSIHFRAGPVPSVPGKQVPTTFESVVPLGAVGVARLGDLQVGGADPLSQA